MSASDSSSASAGPITVIVGVLLVLLLLLAGAGAAAWYLFSPTPPDPVPAGNGQATELMLFRDWEKPSSVLVFTGQMYGYLEPCGCAPEFQKGGLELRHGLLKLVESKGWNALAVDLGGLLQNRFEQVPPGKYLIGPRQAAIQLDITLKALQKMGYVGFGVGPEDLLVDDGIWGLAGMMLNIEEPKPLGISANLGIERDLGDQGIFATSVVRKAGNDRWGFTSVVGEEMQKRVNDASLKWVPPDEVLPELLKNLEEQSDYQALLFHGTLDEAKTIAEAFGGFDLVVHCSEYEEPTGNPERVGETLVVTVGTKGKYVGAVGVFPATKPTLKFELVPLDKNNKSLGQSSEIRKLLDGDYLEQLRASQLVQNSPKMPANPNDPGMTYVGSKKCSECHRFTYQKWAESNHAKALEHVIEKGKQANPECISCHTTGFLYVSGYDGTDSTQHLGGNGCENCHGPGSKHVEIFENLSATAEEIALAKELVHLDPQTPERNLCIRCHDAENSPHFAFFKYWTKIVHKEEAASDRNIWEGIKKKLARKKK